MICSLGCVCLYCVRGVALIDCVLFIALCDVFGLCCWLDFDSLFAVMLGFAFCGCYALLVVFIGAGVYL